MKKDLQKRLQQLRRQGYYFACSNNAVQHDEDLTPNGEYVVVIGEAGESHPPTAIHTDLEIAITLAVEKIENDLAL